MFFLYFIIIAMKKASDLLILKTFAISVNFMGGVNDLLSI